jgi:uncharacterized membrane protein (GlpM family)
MLSLFTLRVIISFVVGGVFISLQTLFAERVPLKWRGVVLTIPSTLAMSLFFVGITKGSSEVSYVAVLSIAASFICTYVFATTFAFFSRFNLYLATIMGFLFWGISALVLILFPPDSIGTAILVGIPVLLICYVVVSHLEQVHEISPVPFTPKHIAIRSIFSGLVVVMAVVFAKTFGNVWGGVFSAFPAVFSTTLIIYYLAHGKEIIPAVTKSVFFPGSIGFALYSVVAGFTFPEFGIWIGTLLSYSVFITYILVYQNIKERYFSRSQNP